MNYYNIGLSLVNLTAIIYTFCALPKGVCVYIYIYIQCMYTQIYILVKILSFLGIFPMSYKILHCLLYYVGY